MEKKNVKEVTEQKATKVAFDYKALAESIEKAFKSNKNVDVAVDTKLEKGPQNTCEADYRYIHFYNPGTTKNMFGLYIKKNVAKFAVASSLAAVLDKSLTVQPVVKKNKKGEERVAYLVVSCEYDKIPATAEKIIEAYQNRPKTEKKSAPKQKAEKKPAAEKKVPAKKAEPKKNIAKRPAKKAVATA